MEPQPTSTVAAASGSRSARPASVLPQTTRWSSGGSCSFRTSPTHSGRQPSPSSPRVTRPWQPPLIMRQAENRTAEVFERQRPSSSSAFVAHVVSSRTQSAKLQKASLAATAPLPAHREPPMPPPSPPDRSCANGTAAGPPSVSTLRGALGEWTRWLEEEEERLDAAEYRQRAFLPIALREGGAGTAQEAIVRATTARADGQRH